jgi:predicted PhzF superfamily epimerase YddE/YHI9
MPLDFTQVDAFTSRPFAGNPAAVLLLPAERDARWMQQVAAEMNLAETAFLLKRGDGFALRWFTPALEVDLCGHATLASAHALWESGVLAAGEQARFQTRSGLLTARRTGDWIELDFPSTPARPIDTPRLLPEALGAAVVSCGQTPFDLLAEAEDEAALRALRPDMRALASLGGRGVIVTCRSADPAFHFVSRFFAPGAGIDEDPATGSAHCALAPFWAERLGLAEMRARQLSPRGAEIRVILAGDRVRILGQAVTVMRGQLLAEA